MLIKKSNINVDEFQVLTQVRLLYRFCFVVSISIQYKTELPSINSDKEQPSGAICH